MKHILILAILFSANAFAKNIMVTGHSAQKIYENFAQSLKENSRSVTSKVTRAHNGATQTWLVLNDDLIRCMNAQQNLYVCEYPGTWQSNAKIKDGKVIVTEISAEELNTKLKRLSRSGEAEETGIGGYTVYYNDQIACEKKGHLTAEIICKLRDVDEKDLVPKTN